ncbi:hypothetical protein [Peribacillus sp. SI8-4]|uniref:hypothetical protein n=1 Tax=Peribacillus sp. SI8-4 TaxID=3048009 RepID=UPI0025529983|nr:hypothetical protein [Peribacillus sp. SI8-4]
MISEQGLESNQFKEGGIINLHLLPLHHQLRVKRLYDGLTQGQLVALIGFSHVLRYSLIENG